MNRQSLTRIQKRKEPAAERYRAVLAENRLFKGLTEEQTDRALQILKAEFREYRKGEFLHHAGQPMSRFSLVLYGAVRVCTDDIEGNRMIMADVPPGVTFGESLCFLKIPEPMVYACAAEDTGVLWLSPEACFSDRADAELELQKRFTALLAERALAMNDRIQILSKLTLRKKLIAFFTNASRKAGSRTFSVSMNRDDMADYVGTNRSALSRELAEMKREGILDYYRNSFQLRE
jgi:CRP-like cAMP-binding protein